MRLHRAAVLAAVLLAVTPSLAHAGAVEFTNGLSTGAGPRGIAAGPDGNLWFTEPTNDIIGRITPAGVITEFPVTSGSQPNYITRGPDGAMWFTELDANQIGRITTSGQVTEYSTGITAAAGLQVITTGPDGNLWFTEASVDKIGTINPTTHVVTEHTLPALTCQCYPWGITTGPDHNLWFTEVDSNAIGRITTSGTITTFPLPSASGAPEEIVSGPDGNLWFTDSLNDAIGMITPDGGTTHEYLTPTQGGAHPFGITSGPDGKLWFTEDFAGNIGQVTTGASPQVTELPLPTSDRHPRGIVTGPDNNMWVAENFGDGAIARVQTSVGLTVPAAGSPPLISGTTIQGSKLTETHAGWSPTPTGYGYQWEDCDGAGNNCAAIGGATGQTYTLTASDIGHTIRVLETATDADGAGTPAISKQTAVIQRLITPAMIQAGILGSLTPTGKGAKIGAILKAGGYSFGFRALEAGRATVTWKAGTKVIATGTLTFTAAGTRKLTVKLTPAGRKLLKRTNKPVKLTARGTFTPTGHAAVSAGKQITLRR